MSLTTRLRRLAGSEPFVGDVGGLAEDSDAFRRVLHTGPELQLVVMAIPVKGDIGMETHAKVEQVIDVLSGTAEAVVDGEKYALSKGDTIAIPPGSKHNIVNTGEEPLRLFTVYSPPNHPPNTVHATKAAAKADKADEAFSAKANS